MITSDSETSVRLTEQTIVVNQPAPKQKVAGWITSTQTSEGQVFYGFFATIEKAQEWAKNLLTGTTIEAVYHPSHNAG